MTKPNIYLFITLNAVRLLSIASILLATSASIFILVTDFTAYKLFWDAATRPDFELPDATIEMPYIPNSTVPNQPGGVFWSMGSRIVICLLLLVLAASELGWASSQFSAHFPVLGRDFGVGPLGIFQLSIGATIPSHRTDNLGLAAGCLLVATGCLNIILGLVLHERAKTIRSWTQYSEEDEPVLPTATRPMATRSPLARASHTFVSLWFNSDKDEGSSGRFGAKSRAALYSDSGHSDESTGETKAQGAATVRGLKISRPLSVLPRAFRYKGGSSSNRSSFFSPGPRSPMHPPARPSRPSGGLY